MKIKPINNFILVEVDETTEQTESGLMVPGVKGEKTEAYAIRAIIIDIAEKVKQTFWTTPERAKELKKQNKTEFKKGDTVLVMKWEGQNVSANAKNYILIKPEHVMALIEN